MGWLHSGVAAASGQFHTTELREGEAPAAWAFLSRHCLGRVSSTLLMFRVLSLRPALGRLCWVWESLRLPTAVTHPLYSSGVCCPAAPGASWGRGSRVPTAEPPPLSPRC